MDSHQIEPYTMKCSDSNPFQWASLSNRTQQTLHDLRRCRPFRRINTPMPPMTFKATSSIFIPSTVTSHLISNDFIRGRFHSTGRLFQFLNWTLRINKSIQSMMVMEGQKKRKVLLFDIELLDSRGQSLYALCTPNITHKPNAQPWCLGALLTADMITKWMDIEYQMLPRGVRAVSPHFEQYRRMKVNLKRMKMEILEIDANQNGNQYSHLRCIRLKHSKNSADKVLYVRFSTFFDIVQSALKSDNVKLVPIVSIVSRQSKDSATNLLDFRFECAHIYDVIITAFRVHRNVICLHISVSTTYCRSRSRIIGSVWCIVMDSALWHWWTATISPTKRFNVILPLIFRVWTGSPTNTIDWGSYWMFH